MVTLLRPLSLGELLDRAFHLYRSRFGLFVGIAALAYLPAFVMQTVILWLPKATSVAAGVTAVLGLLVLLPLRYLAVAGAAAATIIVVSATYVEQPITVCDAYRRLSAMLVRVFVVMVVLAIGISVGLVLLIIPGIVLTLMWALAIPVAVLEDAEVAECLSRSRYLTAGHRWRVFAIFFLYFALLFALELGIGGVAGVFIAVKGTHVTATAASALFSVAVLIIGFLVACLVTPVLTIALSVMYYDERVRKEAFDIHMMIGALSGGPSAPGSTAATA